VRDERFCLGQGGAVAHRGEQLGRPAEGLVGSGVCEDEQAAPLAEEGVGVLGNVPELLPALGRLGIEGGGFGLVTGGFGELGATSGEGVLDEWCVRLDAFRQTKTSPRIPGVCSSSRMSACAGARLP